MELLVMLAILAFLAAVLLPVVASARESGRRTECLSNMRQIGVAVLMYAEDNSDLFPNGLSVNGDKRLAPAEGWAGQCQHYLHDVRVFGCPDDPTMPGAGGPVDRKVSYGLNSNLVADAAKDDPPPSGIAIESLTSSTHTVLLFEVAGVTANAADPLEGSGPGGVEGTHFSAASDGLDNRLYAQHDGTSNTTNVYATGYLGGRIPFDATATQFPTISGRHPGGANYVLADGHASFFDGDRVSAGQSASAAPCNQDNDPAAVSGCTGPLTAAGTLNPGFSVTFSTE